MSYKTNKERAIYRDDTPTKTDQSSAHSTDINIIVGQQLITGYAPGTPKPPMYEDFTNFPQDLREALEISRSTQSFRKRLPQQLQEKTLDELMNLTTNDITTILTPTKPEPKPDDQPKT